MIYSFTGPPSLSMPPKVETLPNQSAYTNLLYLLLKGSCNVNPVSVEVSSSVRIRADSGLLFDKSSGHGKESCHLFAVYR
jgi:hypothetical protein